MADVHPGSWLGDAAEEFKKAPPVAKFLIVGALVAAAGIGFYEYQNNKGGASSSPLGAASPSTDTTGGGANPFPNVPGGNTGQVPVLPGGLQPLFDAAGNLIGFQPGASSGTPTGGGTTTGTPTGGTTKKKPTKGKPTKKSTPHDKGGDTSGSSHTTKSKSHNVGTTVTPSRGKPNPPHPTARKVAANPTAGGAHGYVYTAKGGENVQNLFAKAWPGNPNNFGFSYANNAQLLKGMHSTSLKKGQKVIL